jgi:hypothetical protein
MLEQAPGLNSAAKCSGNDCVWEQRRGDSPPTAHSHCKLPSFQVPCVPSLVVRPVPSLPPHPVPLPALQIERILLASQSCANGPSTINHGKYQYGLRKYLGTLGTQQCTEGQERPCIERHAGRAGSFVLQRLG